MQSNTLRFGSSFRVAGLMATALRMACLHRLDVVNLWLAEHYGIFHLSHPRHLAAGSLSKGLPSSVHQTAIYQASPQIWSSSGLPLSVGFLHGSHRGISLRTLQL